MGLWHFLCDLFYCPESSSHGCPSTRPLAISFDNPSLCFCNEKQHSSSGMTSSVSTGAGTEGATLPKDWIAPAGRCELNLLAVTPTRLNGSYVHWPHSRSAGRSDGSLCSSQLTHQGPATSSAPSLTQNNRIKPWGKWIIPHSCKYTYFHYWKLYLIVYICD